MMLFGLGLLLAVAAWVFSARLGKMHERAPVLLLGAVYVLPALFVALTLWSVQDEQRLRFALLGLGFRHLDGSPTTVEIGGDQERHDVWISAFSDDGSARTTAQAEARRQRLRVATLRGEAAGGAAARATLQLQHATGEIPGLLGSKRDGQLQPIRSLELHDGDRINLAGKSWTVALGGIFGAPATFTGEDGLAVSLPRRRGELPILKFSYPIWRALPPTSVTYPLAWLERTSNANGRAAEGFFYLLPTGLGQKLFLATVDPEVTVERGGQPLEFPGVVPLERGTRLHALSPPVWGRDDFQAGGIRDRRGLDLLPGQRGLAVAYETPEIKVLPWSTLEELAVPAGENGDGEHLRVHLALGGWQLMDRSLTFEHASLPVALEALAILELPNGRLRSWLTGGRFSVATPSGQREARFGVPVWLGDEHLASVQLDVVSPPLWLGVLALVLACCKLAAARAARLSLAHATFGAAIETLVGLRLLLGFQCWALPPFKEEAYELALIAWIFLPWTLIVAGAAIDRGGFARRDLSRWLPLAAGWLFSLVWCLRVGGAGRWPVWVMLHLLVAAVPVLRALEIGRRLASRFERWSEAVRSERATLGLWCGLACAPGALRAVLLVLGFRESLNLGPRFALSLFHVPLALVLEALYLVWLWRRVGARGQLEARDLLPALCFLLGTWLGPAVLVSDLGLALLNVPVFLLALTAVSLRSGVRFGNARSWRRQPWAHRLAPLALVLVLCFGTVPIGLRLLVATVGGVLPESWALKLESERNYLRMLDFAYPRRLEEVARRESENLAVMAATLRAYTSNGFWGRGYLHTETESPVKPTALREHAPAVFVAAQWGTGGTFGLVLVLLVAAAAGWLHLPGQLPDRELGPDLRAGGLFGTLAGLAALTFSLPSLTMILANHRLALFTGKNTYLLGLDSTADVLESWVLLGLFAWGAAAVRDGQGGGP